MIVPSELFVEQFVGRAQYASLERLLSLNFENASVVRVSTR